MAIDITWEDVIGQMTITDGGYVGDLMTVARAHIDDAVAKQRLTSAQAGEIYAAMIPSAFQNGIGFTMQEKSTEASVAKIQEETDLVTIQKVKVDKETALIGLDDVVKETKGVNREAIYTTKYV